MLFSHQALRFGQHSLSSYRALFDPKDFVIAAIAELAGIIMKEGRDLKNNLDGRCGLTEQLPV